MTQPRAREGAYVADDGRRVIEYNVYCPDCPRLRECKKRLAPAKDCQTVGRIVFLIDMVRKASWSGVITLRKIKRVVKDYLECDWDDLPDDIAMPEQQAPALAVKEVR